MGLEDLATTLMDAFESARPGDLAVLEILRAHYHPQIRFTDPLQQTEGLEAFLDANRRLLCRARTLSFTMHDHAIAGDQIFLQWTLRLAMKLGPTLEEDGVTHIRVQQGKVLEHRDYWDIGGLISSAVPGGRRLLRAAFKPFV